MRKAIVLLGMAILASLALKGGVYAAAGYDEAKRVYDDLNQSAGTMEGAEKDCVKAGKSAAKGVLAWKKARELGINKDNWWKKAKMNGIQKAEMELLYKTSYLRFQKAIVDGGRQCYNDPRFQKALTDYQSKGREGE